nr:hypothetical protein [Tanacetum cinerariifolium]
MALPLRDQRHQYLRYEGLQYTDADILDLESRLTRIYKREVHRVQVFNFEGLPDLIADGLSARMLMECRDAQGVSLVSSQIPNKGDLRGYWIWISSTRDFLGTTPSYTVIRDLILRLCHRLIACSITRRIQAYKKIHQGLTVIAPELPIIDISKLVRLQICMEVDDTQAWVAMGLESVRNSVFSEMMIIIDLTSLSNKVLMIDCLSIVETDKVNHNMEIDIVKLMVEIESFGMSADELDKETGPSDGLQPKHTDLSCIHALNEPYLHEIHVVPSTHEAYQCQLCENPKPV